MENQVLKLKPVLWRRQLPLGQVPELPDHVAAVGQIFWRDKVDGNGNTALKIFDLKIKNKFLS